ncbi:large ribosomal subunit protein bL35m [Lissotriton helveticus]
MFPDRLCGESMAAAGAVRFSSLLSGGRCWSQALRLGTRLCSGIPNLQARATVTTGCSKLTPLTHNNIPHGVRFASGFSPLLCKSSISSTIQTATHLNPLTGNVPVLKSAIFLPTRITQQPVRTLTYFGFRKGKRKTVKAVVKRFLRLHCGLWIRRKAGYKKKLWKKTPARKRRLREIVFCNRTQSKLLDKMTTSFWKRRNWYVDDPYQKYHDRTNLKV